MNQMFLSTSGTFDIKGPEGEPRGGGGLLIVIFYLYKVDIWFLLFPHM